MKRGDSVHLELTIIKRLKSRLVRLFSAWPTRRSSTDQRGVALPTGYLDSALPTLSD